MFGIRSETTAAYHPEANGIVERSKMSFPMTAKTTTNGRVGCQWSCWALEHDHNWTPASVHISKLMKPSSSLVRVILKNGQSMKHLFILFVQKLLVRQLFWKKHFNRKELRKYTIHDTIYQGERCRREKIKWENLHQDLIPAHILGNFYIYFSWQEKTAGGAILTPIGVKKIGERER